MDALVKPVEQALLPFFKGLPALPEGARKALVKLWPVLALVGGIVQVVAAYGLWNLGHTTNSLVNYANQLSIAAGGSAVTPSLGLFYYIGLLVLLVDAVILFMAVMPLSAHSKRGWNLLMLGSLLNLAYGVVLLFDSYYGGFGTLLSTLIGTFIGFYLLFQVRDYYMGDKTSSTSTSTRTPSSTATPPPKA